MSKRQRVAIRYFLDGEMVSQKKFAEFVYGIPPEQRSKRIKARISKYPTPLDMDIIIYVEEASP